MFYCPFPVSALHRFWALEQSYEFATYHSRSSYQKPKHFHDCDRLKQLDSALSNTPRPEEPTANAMVMDAVCRNITIIGEAARRLDEPFRQAHPEIPWSSLVGTRNIVMHDYEYLQPRLIREMAEEDVPELLACCLRLLATTAADPRE